MFGDIIDNTMMINKLGTVVRNEWSKTAELRKNVFLDEFVIMPNHLHGIIVLLDGGWGTEHRAPTKEYEQFGKPTSNSIPTIIRSFKAITTKNINQIRNSPGLPVWQRNYYEHIIRNEYKMTRIREYIQNNPLKWELDEENPDNLSP